MEILGIKFAPLNVPLKRRLQTLSAAIWIIFLAGGDLLGYLVTAYILFYTKILRYFMLLYFLFMYYDWDTYKKGGRSPKWTSWIRTCVWYRYFVEYFPAKMEKTVDLDQNRNYLFCCFPHGVLGSGVFCAFGTDFCGCREAFPGLDMRTATLEQHFKVPLFREYIYFNGCIDSSFETITSELSTKPKPPFTGKAVLLLPGGVSESFECKPGTYRLLLKRRKGFVKLALKNGTPMVPVFSFGETDIYDQIYGPEGSSFRRMQNYIRQLIGMAPVFLMGRGFFQYSFGIIPRRKPINVVVGSPMEVPKISEPTREQIDEYHQKFVDKLVELFETHKHKYVENADSMHIELL